VPLVRTKRRLAAIKPMVLVCLQQIFYVPSINKLGSKMTNVASKVLTTVNAPYGASVSAHQLVAKIVDLNSAENAEAQVFAFFSEVDPVLQKAFIKDMGADMAKVKLVASQYAKKAGFKLALAT
jgi:hypothetical protein